MSRAPLTPAARLTGHPAPVMRVLLDATGEHGISADASGLVRAWHVDAGDEAAASPREVWRAQEPGATYALCGARIGKTDVVIAAGAYDRLGVYARETGQPRTHLPLPGAGDAVRGLAYVAARDRVYAATQAGRLVAYELAQGRRLLADETDLAGISCLAARAEAPAGACTVVLGSHDGTLTYFQHSPAGLTRVRQHTLGEAAIYGATFLDDVEPGRGPTLAALASDGRLLWQDTLDPAPVPRGRDAKGETYALALTLDGSRALTGGQARDITVRDQLAGTADVAERLRTDGEPIWSLALSADGRLAAAGDAAGRVLLYRLPPLPHA